MGSPKGRIIGADKPSKAHKHGTIEYARELSAEDVKKFNLTPLGKRDAKLATRRPGGPDDRADENERGSTDPAAARGEGSERPERPGIRMADAGSLPTPRSFVGADSYQAGLDEVQQLAVNLALTRYENGGQGFLLADGTGVGKTRSILAIADQYRRQSGLPVLIITQNRQIIAGSFTADAEAMGVSLADFDIGTYDGLRGGKFDKDYGLVIFDEAHNLKNASSGKSAAGAAVRAQQKLFATATPLDRPTSAAYFMSEITGIPMETIEAQLGFKINESVGPDGKAIRWAELLPNFNWARVMDNMVRMRARAVADGALIRREYPFFGEITTEPFNLALHELADQRTIDQYWQGRIASAGSPQARKNLAGQRILELGRWLESTKVQRVRELIRSELAEGRQVILVAEGVNQTTIKGLDDQVVPGMIGQLATQLEREGIPFAQIYGTGSKADAVRKFQNGDVKLALATPQSGGTGINLDDTRGDRPRTMIVATPNFSGDVFDQMLGRTSRRNTASPARVKFLFASNGTADIRRRQVLDQKLEALRKIQSGEDLDRAYGTTPDQPPRPRMAKRKKPDGSDWPRTMQEAFDLLGLDESDDAPMMNMRMELGGGRSIEVVTDDDQGDPREEADVSLLLDGREIAILEPPTREGDGHWLYLPSLRSQHHTMGAMERVVAELNKILEPTWFTVRRNGDVVQVMLGDEVFHPNLVTQTVLLKLPPPGAGEPPDWRPPEAVPEDYYSLAKRRAWHGSAAKFERFDIRRLGEGEGAQSYGWGLYFADRREVGEHYRRSLVRNRIIPEEALQEYFKPGRIVPSYAGRDRVVAFDPGKNIGGWSVTVYAVDANGERLPGPQGYNRTHFTQPDPVEVNIALHEAGKPTLGALYEVELAPEDDELLDWDEPLEKQPAKVQAALKQLGINGEQAKPLWTPYSHARGRGEVMIDSDNGRPLGYVIAQDEIFDKAEGLPAGNRRQQFFVYRGPYHNLNNLVGAAFTLEKAKAMLEDNMPRNPNAKVTGQELYYRLGNTLPLDHRSMPERTSKTLLAAGVRGIRFADQLSRGRDIHAFERSYNYVIFDDADVVITTRMARRRRKQVDNSDKPLTQAEYVEMAEHSRAKAVHLAPAAVREQVRKFPGTPFAKYTAESLAVQREMLALMRNPSTISTRMQNAKLADFLRRHGEEGAWLYVEQREVGVLGAAEKPVNAVNSSLTNCNPTPDCARYCYVARPSSSYTQPGVRRKAELVDLLAKLNPVRLGKLIAMEYKATREFHDAKALRFFDSGDFDDEGNWVKVIQTVNAAGIRVHVFSKNAKQLAQISPENVRLLSIDSSYTGHADGNDLPIALIYKGLQDLPILEKYADRIQVILPVVLKDHKLLGQNDIDAIPARFKKFVCPIDNGLKVLPSLREDMMRAQLELPPENRTAVPGAWVCTKCDNNGVGLGCYFNQPTRQAHLDKALPGLDAIEQIRRSITDGQLTPEEQRVHLDRLDEIAAELSAAIAAKAAAARAAGREGQGQRAGQEAGGGAFTPLTVRGRARQARRRNPSRPALVAANVVPPGAARIQPTPLQGPTKRLDEIRLDLAESLGHRLRNPVKQPRNAAGSYIPWSTRVNIRFAGDLDVTAHEVAHALDDRYGLVSPWAQPRVRSPFDDELIPDFSGYGSVTKGGPRSSLQYQRTEGVAEWMRAWMVNPTAAEAAAPKFAAHFHAMMPTDVVAKIRAFGDDVRRWYGSPANVRQTANVRVSMKERRGLWERARRALFGGSDFTTDTWLDKLKGAGTDVLHPVVKGIAEARRVRAEAGDLLGADLPSRDPELLMRLLMGFDQKYNRMLADGLQTARGKVATGGGVDWLIGPLDNSTIEVLEEEMRKTIALMVSERIVEKSDINHKKAQDLIDQLEAIFLSVHGVLPSDPAAGPAGIKMLEKFRKIRAAVRRRNQRLGGTGGGIFHDEDQSRQALAELRADPAYPRLQEAVERYRTWADTTLQYMVDRGRMSQQTYQRIKAENEYYAAFHRVMDDLDAGREAGSGRRLGVAAEPIQRFKGSTRLIENPYVNLLKQTYRIYREADRNAAMDAFVQVLRRPRDMHDWNTKIADLDRVGSQARQGDANTIKVFNRGQLEHWQFEEGIYKALKNYGEIDDPNLLWRIVQLPARILRAGVTHSPPFLIRNLIRDAWNRAVLSEHKSKPTDLLKGFTAAELAKFERAGGGQFGHVYTGAPAYHAMLRDRMRHLAKDHNTVLLAAGDLVKGLHRLSELSETTGRLAEYRRAYDYARKDLGYDDWDATLYATGKARGLLDFAIAGSFVQKLNQIVPFVNAAVQGPRRTLRGFRDNPKAFAARWAMYVLAPTALNYAWNLVAGDDDEYRQLPAWRRDFFWNFRAGPVWISIPKPFELGVLASGVERVADMLLGGDRAMEGYAGSVLRGLVPIDEAVAVGPFRGIVENTANYSFFFDRAIVPPWDEGKSLELRDTSSASRIGQLLQKGLQVDARKIDNFIYTQFGGLGRMATDISDVGRKDRSPARFLHSAVGLSTDSPAYNARDVQVVMKEARLRGETAGPRVEYLKGLLRQHRAATSLREKARLAKEIRKYATGMRPPP
jgi:hypothetical protein